MSKRYAVLARIDQEFKVLALTSNSESERLERECRAMLRTLFPGTSLQAVEIQPWPETAGV